MLNNIRLGWVVVLLVCLVISGGCVRSVTPIAKRSEPAKLEAAAPQRIQIATVESIRLRSGFKHSKVKSGTTWKSIGRIPQGIVYRPASGVFIIDNGNCHEASLVIEQNQVVGVYVLCTKSYLVAKNPAKISYTKESE